MFLNMTRKLATGVVIPTKCRKKKLWDMKDTGEKKSIHSPVIVSTQGLVIKTALISDDPKREKKKCEDDGDIRVQVSSDED
jgi:hypothetical protein